MDGFLKFWDLGVGQVDDLQPIRGDERTFPFPDITCRHYRSLWAAMRSLAVKLDFTSNQAKYACPAKLKSRHRILR